MFYTQQNVASRKHDFHFPISAFTSIFRNTAQECDPGLMTAKVTGSLRYHWGGPTEVFWERRLRKISYKHSARWRQQKAFEHEHDCIGNQLTSFPHCVAPYLQTSHSAFQQRTHCIAQHGHKTGSLPDLSKWVGEPENTLMWWGKIGWVVNQVKELSWRQYMFITSASVPRQPPRVKRLCSVYNLEPFTCGALNLLSVNITEFYIRSIKEKMTTGQVEHVLAIQNLKWLIC